jgi:hypothetical protein
MGVIMKKSKSTLLIALLMLVIGVISELIMIFWGELLSNIMASSLAIEAQVTVLVAVYIIYKKTFPQIMKPQK